MLWSQWFMGIAVSSLTGTSRTLSLSSSLATGGGFAPVLSSMWALIYWKKNHISPSYHINWIFLLVWIQYALRSQTVNMDCHQVNSYAYLNTHLSQSMLQTNFCCEHTRCLHRLIEKHEVDTRWDIPYFLKEISFEFFKSEYNHGRLLCVFVMNKQVSLQPSNNTLELSP